MLAPQNYLTPIVFSTETNNGEFLKKLVEKGLIELKEKTRTIKKNGKVKQKVIALDIIEKKEIDPEYIMASNGQKYCLASLPQYLFSEEPSEEILKLLFEHTLEKPSEETSKLLLEHTLEEPSEETSKLLLEHTLEDIHSNSSLKTLFFITQDDKKLSLEEVNKLSAEERLAKLKPNKSFLTTGEEKLTVQEVIDWSASEKRDCLKYAFKPNLLEKALILSSTGDTYFLDEILKTDDTSAEQCSLRFPTKTGEVLTLTEVKRLTPQERSTQLIHNKPLAAILLGSKLTRNFKIYEVFSYHQCHISKRITVFSVISPDENLYDEDYLLNMFNQKKEEDIKEPLTNKKIKKEECIPNNAYNTFIRMNIDNQRNFVLDILKQYSSDPLPEPLIMVIEKYLKDIKKFAKICKQKEAVLFQNIVDIICKLTNTGAEYVKRKFYLEKLLKSSIDLIKKEIEESFFIKQLLWLAKNEYDLHLKKIDFQRIETLKELYERKKQVSLFLTVILILCLCILVANATFSIPYCIMFIVPLLGASVGAPAVFLLAIAVFLVSCALVCAGLSLLRYRATLRDEQHSQCIQHLTNLEKIEETGKNYLQLAHNLNKLTQSNKDFNEINCSLEKIKEKFPTKKEEMQKIDIKEVPEKPIEENLTTTPQEDNSQQESKENIPSEVEIKTDEISHERIIEVWQAYSAIKKMQFSKPSEEALDIYNKLTKNQTSDGDKERYTLLQRYAANRLPKDFIFSEIVKEQFPEVFPQQKDPKKNSPHGNTFAPKKTAI